MVTYVTALAIGIWAAENSNPSNAFVLGLSGLLLLVFVYRFDQLRHRTHTRLISAALLLLWVMAGVIRLGAVEQPVVGAIHEFEGKNVLVHGKISGEPKVSAGKPGEWLVRYEVSLDSVVEGEKNKLPHPISGGVILTNRQTHPLPDGNDGDSLTGAGRVHLFHSYHNPGQPDWGAALAARGIDARISATLKSVRIVQRNGKESFSTRLERWRRQVHAAMLDAMPDQDSSLIMGMLFGGYDGIERQTVRDFAATGIVHILSVSGAHIALVAGAIFWLTRRLSIPEQFGAGIAALSIVIYGVISGFSAPVIRSVIMGLIGMAAIATGRLSYASRALSIAAFGMLIYDPRNLFDISFQLSMGCTAGLFILYPRLTAWLRGLMPDWLAEGIAATLSAQLAVIPFLSWYFGTFPIISLVANMLVVPILEVLILMGLCGTLLAGGFASVAHSLFVCISLLSGLAVEINRLLSRLPGGSISLPSMGIGSGCLYYLILLWVTGYLKSWCWSPQDFLNLLRRRPQQTAIFGVVTFGLIIMILMRSGSLQVHFIDVGQGDATLIITPHGRTILVDTGGSLGTQNGFDVGERVVAPYLRHCGVNSLDWLILTHNHQDHAGGAAAVAEIIGVHQVLLRQEKGVIPATILRLQQAMQDKGLQASESIGLIKVDGVSMKLFQIGEDNDEGKENKKQERSSSENGRSTVVRIEYGRHSFLLTGDMEGESEHELCEAGLPRSTVLKVGHHGSRKSTQMEFLTRVSPQYAVISVGADNRFGHPALETVNRLQERSVFVFRTDQDGAVVFRSNGECLSVEKTVH